MNGMLSLAEQVHKNGGLFIFIYIAEAHAMDEWPLMSQLAMPKGQTAIIEKQHTTTEERCLAAEKLRETYDHQLKPMYLVVEPIGSPFSKLLNPWPTRFYIMNSQSHSGGQLKLKWTSNFERDASIDFQKLSDAVFSEF